MTRALTICAGISAYEAAQLAHGEKPLRYLGSSAKKLSSTFASMWSENGCKHKVLLDHDVTLHGIESIIREAGNNFDFFVLYLAGHGRISEGAFQFAFGDTFPDHKPNVVAIDRLIKMVESQKKVVLVDACRSGRFLEESSALTESNASNALCCITSCKSDQLAWEDDRFEASLFADAILRTLTHRSPPNHRISLTTEFFERIAKDVTRHAFGLKNSVAQEPQLAGRNASQIEWPPPSAGDSRGPSAITTYQVLRRRIRQLLATVAAIAVALALLTCLVTWRPALGDNGFVELRAGPAWLSFLDFGPFSTRVQTSATRSELRTDAIPDVVHEIANQKGIYIWPGNNGTHVRRWASIFLNNFLAEDTQREWKVRLGMSQTLTQTDVSLSIPVPRESLTTKLATRIEAETKMLRPTDLVSWNASELQWKANVISAPGACSGTAPSANSEDVLDFYLHPETADEFASYLNDLALRARIDASFGFDKVVAILDMFGAANVAWQKWYDDLKASADPASTAAIIARFSERPNRIEIAALGRIANAIMARRVEKGENPVSDQERAALLNTKLVCSDYLVPLLADLGSAGDPDFVVKWAESRRDPSRGLVPLAKLARHYALPSNAIWWVVRANGFTGANDKRVAAITRVGDWLVDIGEFENLPPDLIHEIMNFAEDRLSSGDIQAASAVTRVLTTAIAGVDQADAAAIRNLVDRIAPRTTPQTSLRTELLGRLGRAGFELPHADTSELLDPVLGSGQETPSVSYTSNDTLSTEPVTELAAGLTSNDLSAIGGYVIGQGRKQLASENPRLFRFLLGALTDGLSFGVREDISSDNAIAAYVAWAVELGREPDGNDIAALLANSRLDARKREAITKLVAEGLTSSKRFQKTIDELRLRWEREAEPERKLDLAGAIIAAYAQTYQ